jgi:WD40 repeat protein
VAAAGGDPGIGIARVWDVQTGQQVLSLESHRHKVSCVCFSPDGRRLATASADQTVGLWDAQSGEAVLRPLTGHRSYVGAVCFSPDGRRLISGGWDKTIRVWATVNGQGCLVLKGHSGRIEHLSIAPDGKRLASADVASGVVRVWNAPGYVAGR